MKIKIPAPLKKGDTIGITCPAGYMPKDKAGACIKTLQQWGFEVMTGKTLGHESGNYFSGSDDERLNELQAMLDSDDINAILFGRGGYGLSRIIDRVDFSRFRKNPKWLIGFSDITVLHCHLNNRLRIASLHAPMAAAFNVGENEFTHSIYRAITGKKNDYRCTPDPLNRTGKATGELVGGNLSLLAHLIGTPSDIDTKGKILFIEDIGEYLYHIDRMLLQLKRSGKLSTLAGLVVGGFTEMKDTVRPYGKDIYTIIREAVNEFDFPVCFGFPVSHDKENYALKSGVTYDLSVSARSVQLKECL